jgi:hypothetical protein
MKTHFTADDIGKTFATSQQGVTATLVDYDNSSIPCFFFYSDRRTLWTYEDGKVPNSKMEGYNVLYKEPPPSEADLLRKEIEELKASHEADLRTAIKYGRHLDRDKHWEYTEDEIIEKILKHGNT